MPALERLQQRNANFIEQKYIASVLQEEASNILQAQDRVISKYSVDSKITEIYKRRFTINTTTATFTHPLRQRFIDMKRTKYKGHKPVHIHNKIIYGHFNNVVNRLAFGFTQDVKELIANQYNVHL